MDEGRARISSSGCDIFITALTELISGDADNLPPTFTLDYIRLRTLQADFQSLIYRVICCKTLQAMLRYLGWSGSAPQKSYDGLFARITVLIADDSPRNTDPQRIRDSALEIVREAYRISRLSGTPTTSHLDVTETLLCNSSKGKNSLLVELATSLGEELHALVEQEIYIIGNLTPVQIINHYTIGIAKEVNTTPLNKQTELLLTARRIAHIGVLHWRVWAPIIYMQPLGPRFQEGGVSHAKPSPGGATQDRSFSRNPRTIRRRSSACNAAEVRREEC